MNGYFTSLIVYFFILYFKLAQTEQREPQQPCSSETGTELLKSLSRKDARWKHSLSSNQCALWRDFEFECGFECFRLLLLFGQLSWVVQMDVVCHLCKTLLVHQLVPINISSSLCITPKRANCLLCDVLLNLTARSYYKLLYLSQHKPLCF